MRPSVIVSIVAAAIAAIVVIVLVSKTDDAPAAVVVKPPTPETLDGFEPLVRALLVERLTVVEDRPDDEVAWASLAMAYHANDLVDLAERCYDQALQRSPDDAVGWFLLARVRSELGDVTGALDAIDRAIAADGGQPFLHRYRGDWLLLNGSIDEAAAAFERAEDMQPGVPAVVVGRARVALHRGDAAGVIELIEPLLAPGAPLPNIACIRDLLGRAYQRVGREVEAAPLLARGPQSSLVWPDPWSAELYRHRRLETWIIQQARAHVNAGRPDDALRTLEPLAPHRGGDPVFLKTLGMALFASGDVMGAIRCLETVVRQQPDDAAAWLNLGFACERAGDGVTALRASERAVELEPGNDAAVMQRDRIRRALDAPGGPP